ncbi:MAG TPA: GAF domain-containing protein [Thermoanaerobaculia bacterium]|jgi:GAF domain-containing protein
MSTERLAELERQVRDLLRGDVAVAARADGANVISADDSPAGRAMRVVLSELRKEVPYDSCSVQELRGERLVIIGGVGFADLDVVVGESFEIDNLEIPNGEVIYNRRPRVVGDTEQYRAFRRGLHVGAGIRSWLGVPLIYDGRLVGMLALDKTEVDFYTAEHQRVALAFARLAAMALIESEADEMAG